MYRRGNALLQSHRLTTAHDSIDSIQFPTIEQIGDFLRTRLVDALTELVAWS
jgi:hypothetical protein